MANRGRQSSKLFWRDDERESFVNPYNFVRLGDGVERKVTFFDDDELLSGSIACTLMLKTPLAIPDASALSEEERRGEVHKGEKRPIPFMTVQDRGGTRRSIIPGSEIRGVIRAAFEAVDNGCLSVNNSNIASARHPFPRNPGVLVYKGATDTWELHKAKKRTYKAESALNPGDRVRSWKSAPNNSGKTVFRKLDETVDVTNLDQAVEDYFISVDLYCENDRKNDSGFAMYRDNTDRRGRELWSTVQRPKKGQDAEWPVFYEVVDSRKTGDQVVYLSPAQLSRSVFKNRIDDLLGGDGPSSYKHCTDSAFACEPCMLFGFIGEPGAVASRLRFTDALIDEERNAGFKAVTLKELAGPKTSSVEFYTERPNGALTWTYDYKTTSYKTRKAANGRSITDPVRELLDGDDKVKIRGRKFYLHHYVEGSASQVNDAILASCSTDERTIRNETMEVALAGNWFTFEVKFDEITRTQLEKLIWVLCIGENEIAGKQLHKFGHGKPLGLGSAKVVVDSVSLRHYRNGEYLVEVDNAVASKSASELFGANNAPLNDFLTITNYELTKGLKVCYPLADANPYGGSNRNANAQASHQWFIANRVFGPECENDFKPDIAFELPHLPEVASNGAVLQLPKFTKDSNERLRREGVIRKGSKEVFSAPAGEAEEALTPMQKALKKAGLL